MKTANLVITSLITAALLFVAGCNNNDHDGTSADAGQITLTMTLASLPASISYNKATTPDGRVEYNWGVTFDINGDGAINFGDIELQILHFKSPGSMEVVGTIEDLDADLWLYTSDTETTTVASADFQVSGNTITISIDKNAHTSLNSVTESTLVHFYSSTYDASTGSSRFDYYPGFKSLTSIPADGNFTDTQGDADFSYIDMVSTHIALQ